MMQPCLRNYRIRKLTYLGCVILACNPGYAPAAEAVRSVSFAHDIRPILSEHCFHCHGPDANAREADLRLDFQSAFVDSKGSPGIVVPGNSEESELFRRMTSDDADDRMPPGDSLDQPTAKQIETIRQWIGEGANWERHWAFIKPKRAKPGAVGNVHWARNEIDQFVLSRLRQEELTPSPEADKQTLIRRVTLDLTGLPPTLEEVDQFLADRSSDAYNRLVDRLLDSPRYGEQMAASWLDAARYADTYGYQDDGETTMWRWRDWVIDAFNDNMPFDQFTIEQLAGDLIPEPSFSQRLATAFNRNHRHNSEGGAIPEEFRVEYVIDRVDTTATVWLGLTIGCARCHDHKYDPISQQEYYELFAFFNNVQEDGRARKEGNTPPLMNAPTREQLAKQQGIESELMSARDQLKDMEPRFLSALEEWRRSADTSALPPFSDVAHDLDVHFKFNGSLDSATNLAAAGKIDGGVESYVRRSPGEAIVLDGKQEIALGDVGSFSSDSLATIAVWTRPTVGEGVILSKVEHEREPQDKGYTVRLKDGKVHVDLISHWNDDAIRIHTQTRLPLSQWTHLAVTYDGSQWAQGVQVYFDGARQPTEIDVDNLYKGFSNGGSLRLGAADDVDNRFQGEIDELRVYKEQLTEREIRLLATSESILALLSIPSRELSTNQQLKLRTYFAQHFAAAKYRQLAARVDRLQRELVLHRRSYPSLMIMQECAVPRETFLLQRGQYDVPGQRVSADVPSVFGGLPSGVSHDRLALARWLVDPANPLTARVAVNRLWQMSFDQGLVRTVEDFGAQGELPSHPQLLDWLATELVRDGWDLKEIRRLIVTSSTYRQQSHVSQKLLSMDPENRLLARGPRFRLAAEVIRDSALFTSGLLVQKLGGPSVKPYQPPGLWKELGDKEYEVDSGEKLYRRSLYTFWKRTVTHPLMVTFDAPSREICTVREGRTNTPMQALALMNEKGLVEAARVFAERLMVESSPNPKARLARAFRRLTLRTVRPKELEILEANFAEHLAHYTQHPGDAENLVNQGEYPRQEELDVVEVASYMTIAGMLLNLDEVITQH